MGYSHIYKPTADTYVVNKKGTLSEVIDGENGFVKYKGTDTAAIQWALDNLTSPRTSAEKVSLRGDFEINSTITLPGYLYLNLNGKITLANNSDCVMFRTGSSSDVDQLYIINGIFDGNNTNQGAGNWYGLHGGNGATYRMNDTIFQNCVFQNFKSHGLYIENGNRCVLHNILSTDNDGDGLRIDREHVQAMRSSFNNNGGNGLNLTSSNCVHNSFQMCSFVSNTNYGAYINGATKNSIRDSGFYGNAETQLVIAGDRNFINGCRFELSSATKRDIHITGIVNHIVGCGFLYSVGDYCIYDDGGITSITGNQFTNAQNSILYLNKKNCHFSGNYVFIGGIAGSCDAIVLSVGGSICCVANTIRESVGAFAYAVDLGSANFNSLVCNNRIETTTGVAQNAGVTDDVRDNMTF